MQFFSTAPLHFFGLKKQSILEELRFMSTKPRLNSTRGMAKTILESSGFFMPAEWESHEQCWMGWPVSLSLSLSSPVYHSLFLSPSPHLIIIIMNQKNSESYINKVK